MHQQSHQPPRPADSQPVQRPPTGRSFQTKGHLPEGTRETSIEVLNQALADTTDLLLQVKFAHWNVRGPNFYQFHELFEELAAELSEHADDIAERATALGGQAMGTTRIAATTSRIPAMRMDAVEGMEFVECIAERVAIHDANLYDCLQRVSGQEDLDTADLLNEISREVGEFRWFLEAHFITQPSGVRSGMRRGEMEQRQMGRGQMGGRQSERGAMEPQQSGMGSPPIDDQPIGDHHGGGQFEMTPQSGR